MRSFLLVLLAGCLPPLAVSPAAIDAGPPLTVLRQVSFVNSHGSEVFAQGQVAWLSLVRESGEAAARSVFAEFPRSEQKGHAVRLTAPRATGNPIDARLAGAGGVTFSNAQGQRGFTEAARYDGKAGEARGETPVELRGPGFTSHSPGFHWTAADDRLDLGPSTVVTEGVALQGTPR